MKQSRAEPFPFPPGLGKQWIYGSIRGDINQQLSVPAADSHTQIHGNLGPDRDNHSWLLQRPLQQEQGTPRERGLFVPQKNLLAWSRDGFWRLLPQLDALDALPLTQGSPLGTNLLSPELRGCRGAAIPGIPGAQSEERGRGKQSPAIKELLIAALHAALPLLSKFGAVITAAGKGSSCGPAAPSPAFQGFLDLTV